MRQPWRILAAVVVVFVAMSAIASLRWPVAFDATAFMYYAWRITEGDVPYVDFFEFNLPGVHLFHTVLWSLFEDGPVAWRLVDLGALGVGALAMIALLAPLGRVPGVLAAGVWAATHLARGIWDAGERDFFVGVAALVGLWAVVARLERGAGRGVLWLAGAALGVGLALKPLPLPWIAVLAVTLVVVRHRTDNRPGAALRDVLALLVPAVVPSVVAFVWVWQLGGLDAFLAAWTDFLPAHVATRESVGQLTRDLFRQPTLWLLPAAVLRLTAPATRGASPLLRALLTVGIVLGVAQFFAQGKGFAYHAYTFAGPVCLAAFAGPLADLPDVRGRVAAVCTVVILGWLTVLQTLDPLFMPRFYVTTVPQATTRWIADAQRPQLLDTAGGALEAALASRRKLATGWVIDANVTLTSGYPVLDTVRARFLADMDAAAPDVIVVSQFCWPDHRYERYDVFPAFQRWLDAHYTLGDEVVGARKYVRKE